MSDTGAAKLPSVTRLQTSDRALATWSNAVTEWISTRSGGKNAQEGVVTQRDLKALNTFLDQFGTGQRTPNPGDVAIDLGGGYAASVSSEALSKSLMSNSSFMAALGGSAAGGAGGAGDGASATSATPGQGLSRGAQVSLQGQIDALALRLGAGGGGAAAAGERNPVICYGAMGAVKSDGTPYSFDELANFLVYAAVQGLDPSAPATATAFLAIPVAGRTGLLVLGDTVTLDNPSGPTVTKQWRGSSWGVITGAFRTAATGRNPVICYGALGAPFSPEVLSNYLVYCAIKGLNPSAQASSNAFLALPAADQRALLVLGDTATLSDPNNGPAVVLQWRGTAWADIAGAFVLDRLVTRDGGQRYLDNSLWVKPNVQDYPAPLSKMVDALFVLYFSYITPGPDKEGRPHSLRDIFDDAGFLTTRNSFGDLLTFNQVASSSAYIGDLAQKNAAKLDQLAARVTALENQYTALYNQLAQFGDFMYHVEARVSGLERR